MTISSDEALLIYYICLNCKHE
ncbi:MAG: hypothetical protein EOO51_04060 [Flavobacterium sp.]|nr:MAG: hypothetical protein EOO51_04060 [Flavobacterium sp.]